MNLSRLLKQHLRSSAQPPLPYVVDYSVAAGVVKSPLQEDKFPGLLFSHVLRSDTASHLVTAWVSNAHFEANSTAMEALLGSSAQVIVAGHLIDSCFPKIPWYRRVSGYTLLLGIVAFLGAVQALGTYFDWLWRAPRLEMSVLESHRNFVEGSSTPVTVSITNPLPIAQSDLEFSAIWDRSEVAAATPTDLAHLPLGASREFVVSTPPLPPGQHSLSVIVGTKAGLLRRRRNMELKEEIRIWPKMPSATLVVNKVQHETAVFDGMLVIGQEAPNGLYCDLTITGHPGLRYGALTFPGRTGEVFFDARGANGHETALLNWTSERAVGQRELRFRVILMGPTTTEWSKIAKSAEIVCTSARRES